jgi:putative cell wall-binding protein
MNVQQRNRMNARVARRAGVVRAADLQGKRPPAAPRCGGTSRRRLVAAAMAAVGLALASGSAASAATPIDWAVSATSAGFSDAGGRPVMSVKVAGTGDITSDRFTLSWAGAEFIGTLPTGGPADQCSQTGTDGMCTYKADRLGDGTFQWEGRFVLAGGLPNEWSLGTFRMDTPKPASGFRQIYTDYRPANDRVTVSGYRSDSTTNFSRIAGNDRIETALAIANDRDSTRPVSTVIIARSDNYPDALAAGPLAAAKDAVVLFTPPTGLDLRVRSWLSNRVPKTAEVILLGGTGALSPTVANHLSSLGLMPRRIGGADRFETAIAIDQAAHTANGGQRRDYLFVADGRTFADAVCAGAAASARQRSGDVLTTAGLLLSDGRTITASTAAWINSQQPGRIIVMGDVDTSALSTSITQVRINESDAVSRCASPSFAPFAATQPKDRLNRASGHVGVALVSADSFPDGLAAASHASARNLRVLITPGSAVPSGVRTEIARIQALRLSTESQPWDDIVYGGPAAITNEVMSSLG